MPPVSARRLGALAALLLSPALGIAQSSPAAGKVTITESADTESTPIINIAECEGTTADALTYFWNLGSAFTASGTYELWIADQPSTSSACPAQTSNTLTVHSVQIKSQAQTAATANVKDTATVHDRLTSISIPCDGTKTAFYLCVNFTPSGGTQQLNAASGTITLDTTKPPAPTDVAAQPGDSALNVSWKAGTGTGTTNGYRVFWRQAVDGATKSSHDVLGSGTLTYRIENLQNDTPYEVQVAALSTGKNESDLSPATPVTATPVTLEDFWRFYKDSGGHEQGGCAAGAGGLLALLGLVPIALRRRGRRP